MNNNSSRNSMITCLFTNWLQFFHSWIFSFQFLFWVIKPLVIVNQTEILIKFQFKTLFFECNFADFPRAWFRGRENIWNCVIFIFFTDASWKENKISVEIKQRMRQMGERAYATYTLFFLIWFLIPLWFSVHLSLSRKFKWDFLLLLSCTTTREKEKKMLSKSPPSF